MKSDIIKKGIERVPHRALLYATGIPKSEMGKPFIGVATSFTDLIAGHAGMRDLERFIEKGVHSGGGYPFFFGIHPTIPHHLVGIEIFFGDTQGVHFPAAPVIFRPAMMRV